MAETSKQPNDGPAFQPTRRQFAAMGAVATSMLGWSEVAAAPVAISERRASIATERGQVAARLFHPEAGDHPGLVMFAFAAASPSANAAVARQLAETGWSVLLVDAPTDSSPQSINRDAKAHIAWLNAQPGVAGRGLLGGANDYRLRSFGASFPKMSLASRAERQAASKSSVLFAMPSGPDSKTGARDESLAGAARTLHRMAAEAIGRHTVA